MSVQSASAHNFPVPFRVCGVIGSVTAIALLTLAAVTVIRGTGWRPTFSAKGVAIGAGTTTVLIGGTTAVIVRALRKEDPLINGRVGKVDIVPVKLSSDSKTFNNLECYLDKNTGYFYLPKGCGEHYTISTGVAVGSPTLYLTLTVAYNALRLLVVPFYCAGGYIIEKCRGKPFNEARPFKWYDPVVEPARSLWMIVSAPFYTLALSAAAVYSLVDPLEGRSLGAKIERDWNGGKSRAESFAYTTTGFGKMYNDHLTLRLNGQFPSCWQPIGVVTDMGEGGSLSFILSKRGQGSAFTYEIIESTTPDSREGSESS